MTRRILVIENKKQDAEVVRNLLEKEKLDFRMATTGDEGLKEILAMKPDLVIVDIDLPDMSGFDVCSRVKKDTALAGTKVVILSSRDAVDDIKKAFTAGADDYIIKLPKPEFLVRKVRYHLGV